MKIIKIVTTRSQFSGLQLSMRYGPILFLRWHFSQFFHFGVLAVALADLEGPIRLRPSLGRRTASYGTRWPYVVRCRCDRGCLPDSPKPDSPKLVFRVRVMVGVSANRVPAKRVSAKRD